jgi:hypothetical protein
MNLSEKELAEAERDFAESKKVLRIAKNNEGGKGRQARKEASTRFENDQGRRGPSRGALRQFAEAGRGKRIRCLR